MIRSYEFLDDFAFFDVKIKDFLVFFVVQQKHLGVLFLEQHFLWFKDFSIESFNDRELQ